MRDVGGDGKRKIMNLKINYPTAESANVTIIDELPNAKTSFRSSWCEHCGSPLSYGITTLGQGGERGCQFCHPELWAAGDEPAAPCEHCDNSTPRWFVMWDEAQAFVFSAEEYDRGCDAESNGENFFPANMRSQWIMADSHVDAVKAAKWFIQGESNPEPWILVH
jgi:hypothetical protein